MAKIMSPRVSLPNVTIQVLSIIFSILLALTVNEWKEGRNNRNLAETSLRNFSVEIAKNRDEIRKSLADQKEFMDRAALQLKAAPSNKAVSVPLPELRLPDIVTTSWEAALATRAVAYMNNETILKLSEVHLQQKWLLSLEDKVFETISSSSSYDKGDARKLTASLYASMTNIVKVETRLLEMYDETIEHIGNTT